MRHSYYLTYVGCSLFCRRRACRINRSRAAHNITERCRHVPLRVTTSPCKTIVNDVTASNSCKRVKTEVFQARRRDGVHRQLGNKYFCSFGISWPDPPNPNATSRLRPTLLLGENRQGQHSFFQK